MDHEYLRGLNEEQRKAFEADVEELLQLADDLYPDPVDPHEDEIARIHGLVRHPGLCQTKWRRLRVRFIESLGLADDYMPPSWEGSG